MLDLESTAATVFSAPRGLNRCGGFGSGRGMGYSSLNSKTKGNYSLSTIPHLKTLRPDVFHDSEFFQISGRCLGGYIFSYAPPPTGVGAETLINTLIFLMLYIYIYIYI